MVKTMIESQAEAKRYFVQITEAIGDNLSPTALRRYIDLMRQFRSKRIRKDDLIKSLLSLFKEDKFLTEMFRSLMNTEIQELEKKEARKVEESERERRMRNRSNNKTKNHVDEVEEGEIREGEQQQQARVRLRGEIREEEEQQQQHRVRLRVVFPRSVFEQEEVDLPFRKRRRKFRLELSRPPMRSSEWKSVINPFLVKKQTEFWVRK